MSNDAFNEVMNSPVRQEPEFDSLIESVVDAAKDVAIDEFISDTPTHVVEKSKKKLEDAIAELKRKVLTSEL